MTKKDPPKLFTVNLTIGNSDDKLRQMEWSTFCREVNYQVSNVATRVLFRGYPLADEPWQNMHTSFHITEANLKTLRAVLPGIALKYRQKAIALVVVPSEDVEMIRASTRSQTASEQPYSGGGPK